jgi:hypothetical protein
MKTLFTFFAVMFSATLMAQIPFGIRTISPKDDRIPLAQFYTIRDKSFDHTILFTARKDETGAVLENILASHDLTIEEGSEDEAGELYWNFDNGNGFNSTIYRIVNGEYVDLQIVTAENAYMIVEE